VTVLQIAHRAGNELSLLEPAIALGADLLEADVHLRRGRLEIRHGKSLGPVPWLWERWYLLRDVRLTLAELRDGLPEGATLMLDLKGWQPWLGAMVREVMKDAAPYVVCGRRWRMLEAFADLPHVQVVHSARTARELHRLDDHLARHHTWGVSVHRELLTVERVARLRHRADVVMTWPVDTVAVYDEVVAYGVNGVISNDLSVLAAR
jgi:glycerophosphoryl diester phosphodiesterase